MTDINSLDLKEPETSYWDDYEDPKSGGSGSALLPKGEYLVQIVPGSMDFQADKQRNLVAVTTLRVLDGPEAGKEVRFQRFSVRPYPYRRGSEAGDLLRVVRPGVTPRSNTEWEQALRGCEGMPFKAYGDWEAYDKQTGQSLKGMENFPVGSDGERIGVVVKADPQGVEYNVWGNWRWRRVSAAA